MLLAALGCTAAYSQNTGNSGYNTIGQDLNTITTVNESYFDTSFCFEKTCNFRTTSPFATERIVSVNDNLVESSSVNFR